MPSKILLLDIKINEVQQVKLELDFFSELQKTFLAATTQYIYTESYTESG